VQFEIQRLTIEDYDAIVSIWQSAGLPFKPDGRDSKESIEEQLDVFPELFLGALYDRKLIGVVIGSYDYRMKGWINRLAVDPEYREKGVATNLINALEKALKEKGATILCALIESYNKESIKLFKKQGYLVHDDVLYVTKRRSERV
jgi:ribosomal protein S18 acetylase RimI-like enzyme